MKTTAVEQGGDFVINGTKHFISHADHADFVILFAATGEEDGRARQAQAHHGFSGRHRHAGFRSAAGIQERLTPRL